MEGHKYWLQYLKAEHNISIFDISLKVFDFPTSQCVESIRKECLLDIHKIKDANFPDDTVIMDLGANIGIWSLWVAKLYPKCLVVAVEPMPHNYANLVLNIEKNNAKNVMPLHAAVWSKHEGALRIGQHPLNSGSASIEFANQETIPQFDVKAHPLDYLVEKFKPSFIKMDIEGAEYEVMRAVGNWVKIKHISIDMHNVLGGDETKSRARKDWLKKHCSEHLRPEQFNLIEPFDISTVDV